MSIHVCATAILMAATIGTVEGDDPPVLEKLPRYRLEVGQKLRFEGFAGQRTNGRIRGTRTELTLWVVDQVGPGCWKLLIEDRSRRMGMDWSATVDKSLPAQIPLPQAKTWDDMWRWLDDEMRAGSGANVPFMTTVVLHDDGRIETEPQTLELLGDPITALFPGLPRDIAAARTGWEFDAASKNPSRCLPVPGPAGSDFCEFTATRQTRDELGGDITTTTQFGFDLGRGLMTRCNAKGLAATEPALQFISRQALVGTERLDAAWIAQAQAEAKWYFAARDQIFAFEVLTPGVTSDLTARMTTALTDARREVSLPLFVEHLAELTKMADQLMAYQEKSTARRQALIGSLAPRWNLKDLDDRAQSLDNQRGKVVVLDFWYRGCAACIEAMPQIKQVAAHFATRPVAIFGMNIDPLPEDARFVANSRQLNYPTLRTDGTDLAQSYGAVDFGFPTLVVIDRQGVIRDIVIGSSPDLAVSLIKTIDGLLDPK